ncbi:hypothetical protein GQ44DRAFT_787936 [Phaeosphaeriaceae sp. PMI808]|nr:hypothetical protein GQ44DRAFT_787936 [Phaeosphaeriaceae sp. PMI808]
MYTLVHLGVLRGENGIEDQKKKGTDKEIATYFRTGNIISLVVPVKPATIVTKGTVPGAAPIAENSAPGDTPDATVAAAEDTAPGTTEDTAPGAIGTAEQTCQQSNQSNFFAVLVLF